MYIGNTGKVAMRYSTVIVLLSAALTLVSCGKKEKPAAEKPPVAVEVSVAGLSPLSESVEVTGSLEPKFWADVKTQIPGLVKQVNVTQWVRVKKGEALAKIDIAEVEALVKRSEAALEAAKAGSAQAQVAVARAEREQARVLKLKGSGLATQQQVDEANTETDAAKARFQAATAQIVVAAEDLRQAKARLAKGLVTSPMDGVVALRDINVGDLASDAAAGKPVFRIIDNRILNLTVTVPSADSARVRVGQQLEFTVDALPGKIFSGRVMFINPELTAADRSLKIIAEVKNQPEILRAGLFAKGRIVTGERKGVLLIPRSAINGFDLAAAKGVVMKVTGGATAKAEVKTGAVSGDMVEILSGLNAGDQFVVRGGFNLRDGDKVTVQNSQKGGK